VCIKHGGAAPQVRAAAADRLEWHRLQASWLANTVKRLTGPRPDPWVVLADELAEARRQLAEKERLKDERHQAALARRRERRRNAPGLPTAAESWRAWHEKQEAEVRSRDALSR
jgi:hypothetical protein